MKFISQKLAVSGPIHPEFEGVPVPIYLPFGFFPIAQGRHSGILLRSYSERAVWDSAWRGWAITKLSVIILM